MKLGLCEIVRDRGDRAKLFKRLTWRGWVWFFEGGMILGMVLGWMAWVFVGK